MNKIKKLRAENRLTLHALSRQSGVSMSAISALEAGRKAELVTLGKLSKVLGVPLDDLLEFWDSDKPERCRRAWRAKRVKERRKQRAKGDAPRTHEELLELALKLYEEGHTSSRGLAEQMGCVGKSTAHLLIKELRENGSIT
jgi:transcriptional regulator with XRE-family HTH domain